MKDWKCASVKGWPERMIAARSHSINSAIASDISWCIYACKQRTLVKICLVEVLRAGDVHIVEACNLSARLAGSCEQAEGRATHIAMAAEVLEQLDLTQSPLGENLLTEHIGDFLDGHALASLNVGRGTAKEMSSVHEARGSIASSRRTTRYRMHPGPTP